MVLATVAVMTTVVMEFVHDSQVRSRIAANARDSVRAYFLARSGMELSRLMIAFMKQSPCPVSSGLASVQNAVSNTQGGRSNSPATCEDELRILQQMLNLPPTPFWKMIPITSELFQGVADGSFGSMLGVPSPPLVMGVERSDPAAQLADVDEGSGVLFGDMPGSFSVEIDDEDRKIPLKSLWKGSPAQNRAAMMRFAALIAPPRYDALFSGVNSRGEDVDRQEFFLVEDHLLTGEAHDVVLGGQLDGVDRAGFLAIAAVDAAREIDAERLRIPAAGLVLGLDHADAVHRAGLGAGIAGNALVGFKLVNPTVPRGKGDFFVGILHRHRLGEAVFECDAHADGKALDGLINVTEIGLCGAVGRHA